MEDHRGNQTLDLDNVIHTLLKQVRSLVQADTASVFFLEGESIALPHWFKRYGKQIPAFQSRRTSKNINSTYMLCAVLHAQESLE